MNKIKELTRELAIELCEETWKELAVWRNCDWYANKIDVVRKTARAAKFSRYVIHNCFACEYAGYSHGFVNCKSCFLQDLWPGQFGCEHPESIYIAWRNAWLWGDIEQVKINAYRIVNACRKLLNKEPIDSVK